MGARRLVPDSPGTRERKFVLGYSDRVRNVLHRVGRTKGDFVSTDSISTMYFLLPF